MEKIFPSTGTVSLGDADVVNSLYSVRNLFEGAAKAANIAAVEYVLNTLNLNATYLTVEVIEAIVKNSTTNFFVNPAEPTKEELDVYRILGARANGLSENGFDSLLRSVDLLEANRPVVDLFLNNEADGSTFPTDQVRFKVVVDAFVLDNTITVDQATKLSDATGDIKLPGDLENAIALLKCNVPYDIDENSLALAAEIVNNGNIITNETMAIVRANKMLGEVKIDITQGNVDSVVSIIDLEAEGNIKNANVRSILNYVVKGCAGIVNQDRIAAALVDIANAQAIIRCSGLGFNTVLTAYNTTTVSNNSATELAVNCVVIDSTDDNKMCLVTTAGGANVAQVERLNEADGKFEGKELITLT